MKKFIAVGLLVAGTSAFAETTRNIYDLMYLPKAGTVYGFTEATYGYGQAALYSEGTQRTTADITTTDYTIGQTVGAALMDNLSLQASIDYGSNNVEVEPKGGGSSTDLDSTGIGDLDLTARYRLMDAESKLDLLLGGSASFGDAKSPTTSKDGNRMTGGHSVNAGVQYGTDLGGNQFAARLVYSHLFEANDKTSGVKTKANAHNAVGIDLAWLISIAENMYVVPRGALSFAEKFNDDRGGKTEGLTTAVLGAELRYVMHRDLMLRAGLDYTNRENDVVNGIETREDWLVTATVAANYQF